MPLPWIASTRPETAKMPGTRLQWFVRQTKARHARRLHAKCIAEMAAVHKRHDRATASNIPSPQAERGRDDALDAPRPVCCASVQGLAGCGPPAPACPTKLARAFFAPRASMACCKPREHTATSHSRRQVGADAACRTGLKLRPCARTLLIGGLAGTALPRGPRRPQQTRCGRAHSVLRAHFCCLELCVKDAPAQFDWQLGANASEGQSSRRF